MNPVLVYLAQTETTAGFLSQNSLSLCKIKNRPNNKPFLMSVDSLQTLKRFTRVFEQHKNRIRRAQKTTFAYPNGLAIRVVKEDCHLEFLKKLTWSYSTSSNPSGLAFDEAFALEKADVVVYTKDGFFESTPSSIFKLSSKRVKQLR